MKNIACLILMIVVLNVETVAEAQQPTKVARIGYLSGGGSSLPQAFVQSLHDLGYSEGKNLTLEYRTTEGNTGRYADIIAELVRMKVDVIIADGTGPALAAKRATSTIPIVMTFEHRSGKDRTRRQPCSAWRKRNGANKR